MSQSPREREPRDINAVIGEILAWLPVTSLENEQYNLPRLRDKMRTIGRSSFYCAPEASSDLWYCLGHELLSHLPDPYADDAPDWAVQIGKIVRGEK